MATIIDGKAAAARVKQEAAARAAQLKEKGRDDLVTVFILPPSTRDLERRLISRAQMLETLGGTAGESFDRAMDVRISRLRTKLGEDPKNPRLIKTIYGAGYIFLAEVS